MNKSVSDHFNVVENELPGIIDLRGLEAPEPMQKILQACTQMGPDDKYLAHLPHVPNLLFPHLEARGLHWHVHEKADGSALILIRRKH